MEKSVLVETQGGFLWSNYRSKYPLPCQKCLPMQIFAGISPIRKEIFALFSERTSDFIASWWKSSGNSHEKKSALVETQERIFCGNAE